MVEKGIGIISGSDCQNVKEVGKQPGAKCDYHQINQLILYPPYLTVFKPLLLINRGYDNAYTLNKAESGQCPKFLLKTKPVYFEGFCQKKK